MKGGKKIWCAVLSMVIIYLSALIILRLGILSDTHKKMAGIEEAAVSFEEFTIPQDAAVIGIGEATHGNREFQTLKKLVFQKMVSGKNAGAIAFEISGYFDNEEHPKNILLISVILSVFHLNKKY